MSAGATLVRKISDLEGQLALEEVKSRVTRGDDPVTILSECREGLDDIGKRFESGEYFIADLVFAASIFKNLMEVLAPKLTKDAAAGQRAGKVAIATVKDDIHDIGKNLVAAMLDAAGFDVIDLGVDVPAAKICECIKEQAPDVLALSCLLTTTVESMENTIAEVSQAGLRNNVKIIVGGFPLYPELAVAIGADAYGDSATEAVSRCKELLGVR